MLGNGVPVPSLWFAGAVSSALFAASTNGKACVMSSDRARPQVPTELLREEGKS